jgi:hypothetical protein
MNGVPGGPSSRRTLGVSPPPSADVFDGWWMSAGAAKAGGSGPRSLAVPALEHGDVEVAGLWVAEVSSGTAQRGWRAKIGTRCGMARMVVSVGVGRARPR